ncbi:GNAT family N-acetyltransferase [Georgenia faecalis]|uniref:GNAT family N-acetyltransferase n=1 Tax=Georgenia faecalis TaxID=2483799 RepID=A0ABV9D840_9MICO|nr:GNAT family N-acetyltransferase [Georgenia faecalis]
MPALAVLPVRPEDADRLGALTVDAYLAAGILEEDDGYVPVLRDVAGRLDSTIVLAAYRGPRVVGGITLAAPGGPHAEIAQEGEIELRMLAVDPAHQGAGVAEALVRASAEAAAELGHDAVVLSTMEAMPAALRLYARLGFDRVADRDWTGDWDEAAVAAGTAPLMSVYRLPVR